MQTNQLTRTMSLILAGFLAVSGGSSQAADTSRQATSTTQANPHLTEPIIPPLIIIAPTEVRTDPTLAKGCWVRLFAKPNFQGADDLTVAGPIGVPSLHTPEGVNWHARTESILVGPKALLTVYENKDYRAKTMTFKPGEQVPQLRSELKFTQSIDSLKIDCEK